MTDIADFASHYRLGTGGGACLPGTAGGCLAGGGGGGGWPLFGGSGAVVSFLGVPGVDEAGVESCEAREGGSGGAAADAADGGGAIGGGVSSSSLPLSSSSSIPSAFPCCSGGGIPGMVCSVPLFQALPDSTRGS